MYEFNKINKLNEVTETSNKNVDKLKHIKQKHINNKCTFRAYVQINSHCVPNTNSTLTLLFIRIWSTFVE